MVIILDKHKKPLGFATERRVRKFFENHRAVMYRYYPTVVILKDVDSRDIANLPSYTIKIDPGSVKTGIAIIRNDTNEFVWGMQIKHHAQEVKKNLDTRRGARRNRRSRETLYRRSKFADGSVFKQDGNKGRIPPSVRSVVQNTETWIRRLCKWINITNAAVEAVRFDTQLLDNPDIEGKEYQHGTLAGYEIKEYLDNKFQHTCQYCGGESGDTVLEWEHIVPKSQGGSNKVANGTLACRCCNREKGNRTPEQWKADILAKPKLTKLDEARLKGIDNVIAHKLPSNTNRYCAWVNITRRKIEAVLFRQFSCVECSSGGRTKYNRRQLGFLKDHQYDAACVGTLPKNGIIDRTHGYYVLAKATGRGTHFVHIGKTNSCGVIQGKPAKKAKRVDKKFATGDLVVADVPHKTPKPYKFEGHRVGRIAIRASGSFDLRGLGLKEKVVVSKRFVRILQHADGYDYQRLCTTVEHNQQIRKEAGAFPLGNELPSIHAPAYQ